MSGGVGRLAFHCNSVSPTEQGHLLTLNHAHWVVPASELSVATVGFSELGRKDLGWTCVHRTRGPAIYEARAC